jgi:uncharacterized protein (DUF2147 family)
MRATLLVCAAVLVSIQPSSADPTGEWLVKDSVAKIRIEDCGGRMWGIVSWAHQHGLDVNNPDPAKRNRSTLGMPIILGMQPVQPNRWEGEIYNAENGKTYQGRIILTSSDVLRIEGCVLGFLCGGQNWTRVKVEPQTTSAAPRRPGETSTGPRRSGETSATSRKPGEASAAVMDVCSIVGAGSGTTGSAHQRRLK